MALFTKVRYTSLIIMVGVTSLLVLACAWTAAVALPALNQACHTISTGQLVGPPRQLAKTTLAAGTSDWQILIPDVAECPNGPLGAKVLVCDYDVTATASFIDMNIIQVHRNGDLAYDGTVTPTVYCGPTSLTLQNNPDQTHNTYDQLFLSPVPPPKKILRWG